MKRRAASDVPSGHGLLKVRNEPIPDDSYPIKSITLANVLPEEWHSAEHWVLAHGAWGGPTTMAPLMRSALLAARASGRGLTATLYRDPFFGFGRYMQDHRTARNAEVVRAAAKRREMPVHMITHSWSARGSVQTAQQAKDEGYVASLVAYTPANRTSDGSLGAGGFVKGALWEVWQGGSIVGPRSLLTAAAVGAGIVMHSGLAVPTAIAECGGSLNDRLTGEFVKLEAVDEHGVPTFATGQVLAGSDIFFGFGEAAKQHLRAAGYAGAIAVLPGQTHASATSNYRNGAELYAVFDATVRPHAPGNGAYYS